MEPWTDNQVLVRLEQLFEINEDAKYSKPRRISLRDLFAPFLITEAVEMTLNANQVKRSADEKRMRWTPEVDPYANYTNVLTQLDTDDLGKLPSDPKPMYQMSYFTEPNAATSSSGGDPFFITMYPMDIKTFLVRVIERQNCTYSGLNLPRRGGKLRIPNC